MHNFSRKARFPVSFPEPFSRKSRFPVFFPKPFFPKSAFPRLLSAISIGKIGGNKVPFFARDVGMPVTGTVFGGAAARLAGQEDVVAAKEIKSVDDAS